MQSTKLPTWRDTRHVLMTAGLMFGLSLALAEAAHAQEAFSRISTILQRIIDTINGPVGRSLAIIAVMMVGLAWMFGRMDVKQAGAVIVGIGVVFGAAQIVVWASTSAPGRGVSNDSDEGMSSHGAVVRDESVDRR